jgi:tricorn protease
VAPRRRDAAAVGDRCGEERIEVFGPDGVRTLPWDVGHVVALRASPKGRRLAIANQRNQVMIGDLDSGELDVIDKSEAGRSDDLAWSPDGAWLAYTFWTSIRHCAIKLHDVGHARSVLATQPEFRDYAPSFDPDGRYLYFLSLRTFDPVYDAVQFELSFPRAARPYLIALQGGGAPPFDPAPKSVAGDQARAHAEARIDDEGQPELSKEARAARRGVHIDLDGLDRRIAAFPVPENRLGQITGIAGGKVLWTVLPIVGAHGRGGHKEQAGRVEVFDFTTGRAESLLERADRIAVAGDHITTIVRDGKRLRAIAANRPPESLREPSATGDAPSRKTGWIDLARIRLNVEPRQEWRQMLREVWRLLRDQFWVADMSGVDWDGVYARYEPLLARVATRAELSDLVWEMQGELGTSHAYEMGGDHRKPPQVALGYLAAELRLVDDDSGGYEIVRTVSGDPWDAQADSPLNAVGVEARPGERIIAVNGTRTSRERPPESLLVHQAGTRVELTLASSAAATRNVVVTTLDDEVPARYREWVEANRALVHSRSEGRVGYLHLPDMQSAGFAEFHRYFAGECDRDGLIVDVRYNRGGHVSQLLLEKVARKRSGYSITRWGLPSPYPDEAVAGPVVALCNEHAGSDGDIFSHNFKLMGIGPLVGTRTWGGVVGIWPRHALVDGTQTTQPEYAFWFSDVGWGVENYGTDPQIEIDNTPQDGADGRDRQLETAIATALDLIARANNTPPAFDKRPRLGRGPLPPRR